jgi:hypothetical protein
VFNPLKSERVGFALCVFSLSVILVPFRWLRQVSPEDRFQFPVSLFVGMLVIESALFDGDRMSEEGIHKPFLGCAANDGGVSRGEEVPTVIESGHFRAYFFAAGAVVIEDQVIAGFGWPGFRVFMWEV